MQKAGLLRYDVFLYRYHKALTFGQFHQFQQVSAIWAKELGRLSVLYGRPEEMKKRRAKQVFFAKDGVTGIGYI